LTDGRTDRQTDRGTGKMRNAAYGTARDVNKASKVRAEAKAEATDAVLTISY